LIKSVVKGADWIGNKRIHKPGVPHDGLLPAGFSAEHLGPNDYYYWDDFWAVAGLKAAADLCRNGYRSDKANEYEHEADNFLRCIYDSIRKSPGYRRKGSIPASPNRRMDAGAVGSLVADYPLQLTKAGDEMIMKTVSVLREESFYNGAFFQNMIHSGINAYLTLDIAQTLLRAGDPDYRQLIENVRDLASSTGQWPEAIHPFSGGGCMGDGQHGWAAAEWIMMIRNLFVREEENGLIVGSGLFREWVESEEELLFGPTPTPHGDIALRVYTKDGLRLLKLEGKAAAATGKITVRVPGYQSLPVESEALLYELKEEINEEASRKMEVI
jgi:hypothetical protein